MGPSLLYIAPIFLATSILYSMIGQGGASAYLAILVLFNLPYQNIPPTALACNIIASLGIAFHFAKAGHLRWKLIIPFIITSVPAAFIGGTLRIPETAFEIILAVVLMLVSIKLFFWKSRREEIRFPSTKKAFIIGPIIGLFLGLLAGLIGIGGGILLTPILIFMKWGRPKKAALAGGLFTLANSVSGLIGHGTKGHIDYELIVPLALAVLAGSQIGAHLGAKKISSEFVQKIFAILLFVVSLRLFANILNIF